MLAQDSAGVSSISLDVREPDAIDAGWQQAIRKARQESGYVEEDVYH
ncbi:hypothetical protein [Burkholderia lata]|nr:hypothetical protein [Burkholderia lata]